MIILGIALLIAGLVFGYPLLVTVGVIVAVVGAVLLVLGRTGRSVGGRSHYY